jgi:hypothetical protein
MRGIRFAALVCAVAAGCSRGGSPAAPSGQRGISGHTVSALDSGQAANIGIQIGSKVSVQSDASGFFHTEVDEAGHYPAVLQGSSFVERKTTLDVPADGLTLSLIPSGFDLRAFDELCRTSNAHLQRWAARPRLVVLTSVMRFTSLDATDFAPTGEQMSAGDVDALIADAQVALALLTSGTWTDFENIERVHVPDGVMFSSTRTGAITIGRYLGVETWAKTIGYGRWATQANGTVVGGSVYLDRDFDANSDRRRLLRTHEVGHALGYMHVTSRVSIMNPALGPEPTDFDRQAVRIAFARPPGNKSPDEDPGYGSGRTGLLTTGGVSWSGPIK